MDDVDTLDWLSELRINSSMPFDLEKLEDSEYLLDILISVENVLDSLDVYVYRNWFDGEVVEGPIVRRHWVIVSLLYPYNKMPDPRAALRLLKHGVQVEFDTVKQQQAGKPGEPDTEPSTDSHWIIKIIIPRRLLDQIDGVDLAMYDDEVNPDDVTAAKDIGLDDESPYQTDEQLPDQSMQPLPGEPPPAPTAPQGQPNA
jgi:hypothetical protein